MMAGAGLVKRHETLADVVGRNTSRPRCGRTTMSGRVGGKVAIVTGAARGLGAAYAGPSRGGCGGDGHGRRSSTSGQAGAIELDDEGRRAGSESFDVRDEASGTRPPSRRRRTSSVAYTCS